MECRAVRGDKCRATWEVREAALLWEAMIEGVFGGRCERGGRGARRESRIESTQMAICQFDFRIDCKRLSDVRRGSIKSLDDVLNYYCFFSSY